MNGHLMTDPAAVKAFVLAGNARITLVSKATGARFSYRIRASDDGHVHFVSVLTGSDNENSYSYMGILKTGKFIRTMKSRIDKDAPSCKAWTWFWSLLSANVLHNELEVWHSGKCCRCGRTLTVPESIESGWGPECKKYRDAS